MADLNPFETLFMLNAICFQLVLVAHFALRKWRFHLALRYGPIVYALSLPSAVLSVLFLLGGVSWEFYLGGLLYLVWAALGYWVEYVKQISWRDPLRWSILVPYITLYLASLMFYWWPLALIHKPLWYVYTILFLASTVLNLTSHHNKVASKNLSPAP